jgi:hypothetical protein
MARNGKPRKAWGWLVAALVTVMVVPAAAFGYEAADCVDYVVDFPLESYCTSGPAVGVTAAWLLSAGALVFAVYAVRRGLRVGRHRSRSK